MNSPNALHSFKRWRIIQNAHHVHVQAIIEKNHLSKFAINSISGKSGKLFWIK